MLSLFDCLAEGIATLFVFGHVSGHFAMIKSSGLGFQFCANAAINLLFLVREGFNSHNITDALANKLAHQQCCCLRLPEHIPVHVIEAILKNGIQLGRPALDRPEHGRFLS